MFYIIDGNIIGFFTSLHLTECKPIPNHLHGSFEILIVTDGTICVSVNNSEYILKRGDGIFINSFENHAIDNCENSVFYALMFTKETTPHFCNFLKDHLITNPVFRVSKEVLSVLNYYLPDAKHTDDIFRAQAVLCPLIFDIHKGCSFVTNKNRINDSFYSALEYMSMHATEKITLETVARAIGIHPTRLSSCLNKHSTSNFNAILNRMRCSYAVSTMQNNSNLSITEIAYQSGFGSIRTFNRSFLEVYGITPTDFRQQKK